jgi:hypothetical protein
MNAWLLKHTRIVDELTLQFRLRRLLPNREDVQRLFSHDYEHSHDRLALVASKLQVLEDLVADPKAWVREAIAMYERRARA